MPDPVSPTPAERSDARPGDELVPDADVVMDRAFSLPAPPAAVWPWIVQLGKDRAGWYLPRTVERLIPRSRRALRRIDPQWQVLEPGDVVPDWGGRHAYFEVVSVDGPAEGTPGALVYRSQRGRTRFTWVITVSGDDRTSRVHLRLRIGPVKRIRLAETVGGSFDLLTIVGLAAGLRERVRP